MESHTHSEVLVGTQWLADHLNDPNVRVLEVGLDPSEYESGHIPNAVAGWGFADLQRPDGSDIANKAQIESMFSQAGITNSDTVILYGGLDNLVAAFAFWILKVYGHGDLRLLDGGRRKWLAEERPVTTEKPTQNPTQYMAKTPNLNLRADKEFIASIIDQASHTLVDARPIEMYTGEEKGGIARGGHIPTAVNVPPELILDSDGAFKSVEELRTLFIEKGITPDKPIITYCVRGGLSCQMWFVLTQLLDYPNVREYDLSWAEWGNSEDLPLEK